MSQYLIDAKPWLILAAALLPTLITGLTQYPRVDGFLKGLLNVLDALSIVSHSDSPGTFKVGLSRPPPVVGSAVVAAK